MVRSWVAACVVASALAVAGCAPGPSVASGSSDAPPTDRADPRPPERTVPDPPARPPQKQAGLFFPRLGPASDFPQALGGRLVVRDRCIHMAPDEGGGLVVWPHGYSLRSEGGDILVLDGRGEVAAKVGEEVRMGGGQITQDAAGPTPEVARRAFAEKRGELGVPDRCRGPL